MAENSDAEKTLSPLREIVRNRSGLWWTGGAALLIALVEVTWLERKRIHFSLIRRWIAHTPDWFLPVGLTAGALLALAILWKVPQWQVKNAENVDPKERFNSENEARKTLATILGGAAFLVGGFFTWQNLKVAQDAASTSQRALAVSQEGQITDRFGKAIEQLGAVDSKGEKKLEVRLGGIYALEGIANDSKELHWPIMEVLCTYVRVNAPRKPQKSTQKNQTATAPPHPDADIQAILTVLGRRERKYERLTQLLNLGDIDIRGADLHWANLWEANLSGADLRWADLSGADLIGTDLSGADLAGADLVEADLRSADLVGAVLAEADLSGAVLAGADLSGANLVGADLRWADLRQSKGLTQEQVDAAKGNSHTKLPENLHMPESWKK